MKAGSVLSWPALYCPENKSHLTVTAEQLDWTGGTSVTRRGRRFYITGWNINCDTLRLENTVGGVVGRNWSPVSLRSAHLYLICIPFKASLSWWVTVKLPFCLCSIWKCQTVPLCGWCRHDLRLLLVSFHNVAAWILKFMKTSNVFKTNAGRHVELQEPTGPERPLCLFHSEIDTVRVVGFRWRQRIELVFSPAFQQDNNSSDRVIG